MDKLKKNQKRFTLSLSKGFLTIELMISLAIMALVLTAVVLVSFSNQSSLVGTTTNNEAIKIAQKLLEQKQAEGRKDFHLVNPSLPIVDGIYTKEVFVDLLPDFLTKRVKAHISWTGELGQKQYVELVTLVSNFDAPAGGNTCDSTLTGNWEKPEIEIPATIEFSQLPSIPDGAYALTDVDAYQNRLYVTAGKTFNNSDPTLFIFDIETDIAGNVTLDHKDDGDNASGVISGLNAIRVSEDLASNPKKTYAYVASNTLSDYPDCDSVANPACGQFYIFEVTGGNINSSTNLEISSTLPVAGQMQAQSIFYKNNYVFLGLTKTTGPEFHILDVHNPEDLYGGLHLIYPVGSFEVDNGINAIWMRGGYAYLTSPNNQELQILNIANPTSPVFAGGFGAGVDDGNGNGKSLHLVGDTLYFGRTVLSGDDNQEFHILDNTDSSILLPELGRKEIGASVNQIIVRDYLAFLLTKTTLEVYDVSNPADPEFKYSLPLPEALSGANAEPSMDCEGNRLYITVNGNVSIDVGGVPQNFESGFIYVIKPGV